MYDIPLQEYVNHEACTAHGVTAVAYRFIELRSTLLRMASETASGMVSYLLLLLGYTTAARWNMKSGNLCPVGFPQ